MIVYVETNFVLELVLQQEQANSCLALLALAEAEQIKLALPAYSLIEPIETLTRRAKNRERLRAEVATELNQLKRKVVNQPTIEKLNQLNIFLNQNSEDDKVLFR